MNVHIILESISPNHKKHSLKEFCMELSLDYLSLYHGHFIDICKSDTTVMDGAYTDYAKSLMVNMSKIFKDEGVGERS